MSDSVWPAEGLARIVSKFARKLGVTAQFFGFSGQTDEGVDARRGRSQSYQEQKSANSERQNLADAWFCKWWCLRMNVDRSLASLPGQMVPAVMHFIIRWTECLHADGSLRDALIDFSDLARAEVVHLHRLNKVTGAQHAVATVDRSASQGARPLTRGHGMALVGQTLSRAKPGTLWSMQELDRDAVSQLDARVLAWMEGRSLRDAMLIPLSSAVEQTDVLEFYLSAPLDRPQRQSMETLAAATAEAWGRRPEGRIARILRAAPAINGHHASRRPTAHALSQGNPLGLTPAEMRICSMIQRGSDLAEIGKTLHIADSTLRSHLRSIFAKAGVAGQVGLVRMLLEPEAARSSMRA